MARYIIFHDEMQEADVLDKVGVDLVDRTEVSERILYLENPNEDNEVIIWWNYFYHRILGDQIAMQPEFDQPHSGAGGPKPGITKVALLPDKCGLSFTIPAGTARPDDSWMLNCAVAGTYFNEKLGRTYTHQRTLQGIIVSTKEKVEDYRKRVFAGDVIVPGPGDGPL